VEGGQKLPVGALGTAGVRVEEVTLLQGIGDQAERTLPCAVQKVNGSFHPLPMLKQ